MQTDELRRHLAFGSRLALVALATTLLVLLVLLAHIGWLCSHIIMLWVAGGWLGSS